MSTADDATSPDDATLPPGRTRLGKMLGPYELLEELGSGGMGVVYKARIPHRAEPVAVKVLLAGGYAGKRALARFKAEAEATAKLDHPGIIPIYDVGEHDGVPYFAMKLVAGELLEDWIGTRPVEDVVAILRDVARAVHHAHERGVIHRDLKPGNVIIERATGKPYVMDFGLAKDLDSDMGLSKTGVILGTPYYMPPEQARGKHAEIDPRSDVYGLGAVLYEVLAGRPPYQAETQAELIGKILTEKPPRPSDLRGGVRLDLEAIALKAISKKKEDRYPSAEALALELDRALAGEEVEAPLPRYEASRKTVLAIAALAVLAFLVIVAGVVARELSVRRRVEEAKRLAEDAARAADGRKKEAEELLAKGRSQRLLALGAPSLEANRSLLADAVTLLSSALERIEGAGEARALVLLERGLARRDLGAIALARSDLAAAATAPTLRARANVAFGSLLHRRDHDLERARAAMETARTAGEPASDAARLEEHSATLLAQAYLQLMEGDPPAARSLCRRAESAAGQASINFVGATAAELEAFTGLMGAPPEEPEWHAAQALRAVERGLAAARWRYELICDRAWARALGGDSRRAADDLALARRIDPDGLEARLVEGWLAVRRGDESAALEATTRAAEVQPEGRPFWEGIAKRLAGAAAFAKKRAGAPHARGLFGDLPVVYDVRLDARVVEVSAALERKDLDWALSLLEKLEADDPKHPSLRLWRARLLLEAGRDADARALADSVLEGDADEPLALCLEALVAARARLLEKASSSLRRCMEAHPELRTPRMLHAQLLAANKQWDEIEKTVRPLVDMDPTDADAAASLANALLQSNRLPDAIATAEKALEVQPRSVSARVAGSRALLKARRGEDALRVLEEGVRLLPASFTLLLEHATTLAELGKESAAAFDKARAAARSNDEKRRVDELAPR